MLLIEEYTRAGVETHGWEARMAYVVRLVVPYNTDDLPCAHC
jgi:hypothetical protein